MYLLIPKAHLPSNFYALFSVRYLICLGRLPFLISSNFCLQGSRLRFSIDPSASFTSYTACYL